MRSVWFALLCMPVLAAAQQLGTVPSQTGQQQQSNTPPPPPTRPEDLCTIEGQAVNALTGEPVKKAQVIMNNLGGRANANLGAITDAAGHFTIEKIDPGRYNISAERNGYVHFQYGARTPDRPGAPVTLDPGQKRRDLVLKLVPQGVITGKVLDEDGEPVEYAQIRAMRYAFVRGKRQMAGGVTSGTDDLGEYRIYGLSPGKYYISASYRRHSSMTPTQDRQPAAEANEGYAPTYFPGTTDPGSASAIQVPAGAMLGGVDITLRKARTVRIRGHLVNPAGEELPPFVSIRVVPRDGVFLNSPYMARAGRGGVFEIRDLTPGAYMLLAQWSDENKFRMVRQPVEVGNSNLDDVTVLLTPAMSLKGQLRVDGTADVNLGSANILLTPQGPMPMGMANARADEDGMFTLDNVNADSYAVTVRGLPPTFFVKSIRMGDTDALDAGLDLTQGSAGTLDILVSPNGGEIDGVVANSKGEFASGATVVLVPDAAHRQRTDLFKTTATDTSGHFSLKGISPGEYKLFAWEDIEPGAYQDPEFLAPFENQGESVTIREGSRENRQLKLIPAESTPKNAGS